MIDMRCILTHRAYPCVVEKFEASFDKEKLNCKEYWFAFKDLQSKISYNKCPICEVTFNQYPNKTNTATLDHFRPKDIDMYPDLKCEPKNYLLMCSLCNNIYKDNKFPLIDDRQRFKNEEPLLFNPIDKNPLDFFKLAFLETPIGGVMQLEPKNSDKDSYEHKISERTIKMFSLRYCNEDSCQYKRTEWNQEKKENESINVTQVSNHILREHYRNFIELSKARSNKKSLALFFKDENRKKELEKYGFFRFIMKEQFSIN